MSSSMHMTNSVAQRRSSRARETVSRTHTAAEGPALRYARRTATPAPRPSPRRAPSLPRPDGASGLAARKRIVSGVQPTGTIHLGNYLGAIKNWVPLQITMPHEPAELAAATRRSAAVYIACGVNPSKASIFVQSHVPAHAELTWLLSCVTPISWLNKMIQFKEKSRKACDLVPVGEDQRQHLELTRDVATRVNNIFGGRKWKKRGGKGGRVFKVIGGCVTESSHAATERLVYSLVPEALIPPAGARVMSLTDGTAKMSKSAPSDLSRINLLDSSAEITNKIKRCKTDAVVGMTFDDPERPECNNLLSIYQLVSGRTKEEIAAEVRDMSWGNFKPLLADAVVAHLEPVQRRYAEVVADPSYLDSVLASGADRANEIAGETLLNVYDALGFAPRWRR
eukprot:SM000106S14001  [mRNA]  locus=s106:456189:459456:- [translate_table: standard]